MFISKRANYFYQAKEGLKKLYENVPYMIRLVNEMIDFTSQIYRAEDPNGPIVEVSEGIYNHYKGVAVKMEMIYKYLKYMKKPPNEEDRYKLVDMLNLATTDVVEESIEKLEALPLKNLNLVNRLKKNFIELEDKKNFAFAWVNDIGYLPPKLITR